MWVKFGSFIVLMMPFPPSKPWSGESKGKPLNEMTEFKNQAQSLGSWTEAKTSELKHSFLIN